MKCKEIKQLKFFYRENTEDELVLAHINDLIEEFIKLPEYFPHNGDIFVDIGAHIGAFTLLAASQIKDSRVFAIEACKETFDYLVRNVNENHINNASTFHLALDKQKGMTKLYYNTKDGNWGHTTVKAFSEEEGENVPSDTLPNFLRDNHIDRCDYLKMNCEGAEFNILLSSDRETLQKCKLILILYHLDLAEGASLEELRQHLINCGFVLRFFKRRKERGWLIARNKSYTLNLKQYIILNWRIFLVNLKRLKAIPQRIKLLIKS